MPKNSRFLMFKPAKATSFSKFEPRIANVSMTCGQQKRFEPSKASVDICCQHQLEQCKSYYMFTKYICLSFRAVSFQA